MSTLVAVGIIDSNFQQLLNLHERFSGHWRLFLKHRAGLR